MTLFKGLQYYFTLRREELPTTQTPSPFTSWDITQILPGFFTFSDLFKTVTSRTVLSQLDTGTSSLNYLQEVEKCQSTLLGVNTRSEIMWGHACNTNPCVLQVTAWLGMVTPSLCCTFWYNTEYLCWGTRNQRNNLRQTNSSTLYSSYPHFKTKLSLERCSVFTCSIQVCWDQCHHIATFYTSKMQSHVKPWVSDLEGCWSTIQRTYFQNPWSFTYAVQCSALRTATSSRQESYLWWNLLLHFCPSLKYNVKVNFSKISIHGAANSF